MAPEAEAKAPRVSHRWPVVQVGWAPSEGDFGVIGVGIDFMEVIYFQRIWEVVVSDFFSKIGGSKA